MTRLMLKTLLAMTLTWTTAYAAAAEPAPFSQPVAGTTLTIEMVPVTIGDSTIWIARHETSWDLYDAMVYRLDLPDPTAEPEGGVTRPTKPYIMADRGWGHANFPALSVSHRGAQAFCEWMSEKTGRTWRVPTEQEWTALCTSSGVTPETLDDHAWHKDNSKRRTHELGTKKPDAHGLHDLHGNVGEWCTAGEDGWVLLGGHFRDRSEACTCTMRRTPVPEWNDTDPQIPKSIWWLSDAPFAGFRVVCESAPDSSDASRTPGPPTSPSEGAPGS